MIYNEIKAEQVLARKAKDKVKASCLTTLMGELQKKTIGTNIKEISDELCLSTINKFLKDINLVLEHKESDELKREKEILSLIVKNNTPEQMSEDELTHVIQKLINEGSDNIGKVMAGLKHNYNGLYDGGMASKIIKSIL